MNDSPTRNTPTHQPLGTWLRRCTSSNTLTQAHKSPRALAHTDSGPGVLTQWAVTQRDAGLPLESPGSLLALGCAAEPRSDAWTMRCPRDAATAATGRDAGTKVSFRHPTLEAGLTPPQASPTAFLSGCPAREATRQPPPALTPLPQCPRLPTQKLPLPPTFKSCCSSGCCCRCCCRCLCGSPWPHSCQITKTLEQKERGEGALPNAGCSGRLSPHPKSPHSRCPSPSHPARAPRAPVTRGPGSRQTATALLTSGTAAKMRPRLLPACLPAWEERKSAPSPLPPSRTLEKFLKIMSKARRS